MSKVIPPNVNKDDQIFWIGVGHGRLLVRECAACAYLQHPPTPMCPKCGGVEWNVRQLSGRGSVNSWIVSKHPNQQDDEGRIVAVIDLAEGLRFVSNLIDVELADVRPGLEVEVEFVDLGTAILPQFRPVSDDRVVA